MSAPNDPSAGSPIAGDASAARGWTVRAAPLGRLPDLALIALATDVQDRRALVLSVIADLLRRSAGDQLYLAELVAGGTTVAAAIAARTAEDSASLLAAGVIATPDAAEVAISGAGEAGGAREYAAVESLLRHLHQRLADAGVRFVQAMREPDAEQETLAGCGYELLATLDYLVATCRRGPCVRPRQPESPPTACGESQRRAESAATARPPIRLVAFEQHFAGPRGGGRSVAPRDGFVALIESTYVGSLDCPQMERFRSAAAMVDSYRQSHAYNPHDWQVMVDAEGRELGCLLATARPASGVLEIAYMGLVPEARHQGWAAAILEQAWQIADAHRLPQLTVAVDRANHPAIQLYRRHGFEHLMSEAVWGRAIGIGREKAAASEIQESRTVREP